MVATRLKDSGAEVLLVDQKSAPARKFLVAGDGGFNLTHSENLEAFVQKYDCEFVRRCVRQFSNTDFRSYLSSIGIETFVGSSGKVFPVQPTKPIEVLNAWLRDLDRPEVLERRLHLLRVGQQPARAHRHHSRGRGRGDALAGLRDGDGTAALFAPKTVSAPFTITSPSNNHAGLLMIQIC